MINRKIFSERLLNLRAEKQLTQKQLGIDLGTIKQTINNWEKGVSIPSLDVAAFLADYFSVSLDFLVGRTNFPDVVMRDEAGNIVVSNSDAK